MPADELFQEASMWAFVKVCNASKSNLEPGHAKVGKPSDNHRSPQQRRAKNLEHTRFHVSWRRCAFNKSDRATADRHKAQRQLVYAVFKNRQISPQP